MRFSFTANSPLEEVPATAQFYHGLLVFYHVQTASTVLLLPPGRGRNVPIVYQWKQPNLTRSSPAHWTRDTISNNVATIERAIEIVTNDILTELPAVYTGGCGSCGH